MASRFEVSFDADVIGPWVFRQTGEAKWPGGTSIGLYREGELVAGIAFEGYTGTNIFAHVCILDKWATNLLFKLTFRYIFEQLGLKRLTMWTSSSNIEAIELHKRLGGIPEGRLIGAGRDENDILISRLTADSCKYWRKWNGKVKRTGTGSSGLCYHHPDAGTVKPEPVQYDVERSADEQYYSLWAAGLVSSRRADSE